MKMTIGFSQFVDAFRNANRQEQFSYGALKLLYNHFEETDPDYDLDVIAICCEYVEMTQEEILDAYPELKAIDDGLELEDCVHWLALRSWVVGTTDSTVVFESF